MAFSEVREPDRPKFGHGVRHLLTERATLTESHRTACANSSLKPSTHGHAAERDGADPCAVMASAISFTDFAAFSAVSPWRAAPLHRCRKVGRMSVRELLGAGYRPRAAKTNQSWRSKWPRL